jgi:hypothetical protein
MSSFKSRKFKHLKKQRKNKTKHLKNKRRNTLKQAKHKLFRKTKNYNNARQYLGGAGEGYMPPLPPDWLPSPPPEQTFGLPPSSLPSPLLPPASLPSLLPPSLLLPPPPPPPMIFFLSNEVVITVSSLLFLLLCCYCCLRRDIQYRISDGFNILGYFIGNTVRRRPGAPTPVIQMQPLPQQQVQQPLPDVLGAPWQNIDDECFICLEKYKDVPHLQISMLLPCRHTLHSHCLEDWSATLTPLQRQRKICPICKKFVITEVHNVTLSPAPDVLAPIPESALGDIEVNIPDSTADSSVSGGGANSLLDAIAESLKNVDTKVLIKTFKYYSEFLDLTHNDYEDIVELFININNDTNLEELIIIITRGLGFSCTINNKTVESTANKSDKKLAKILGTNSLSKINATLQTCTSVNGLNLSENQFEAVEKIKNLLTKTLSINFNKPNKKQLLRSLDSLELSRTTLNRILKRNK